MTNYVIIKPDEESNGFYFNYFFMIYKGFVLETRFLPAVFPNKKKAKRILRRLHKYHDKTFFIVNYDELIKNNR